MPTFRDLTNARFGRWSVLRCDHKRGAEWFWQCRCDCGTERVVNGSSLKKGLSQSCGCLHREHLTRHGMKGTPTYQTWLLMKQRCHNPKAPDYARYGGRGIEVCESWQTFANFFRDMGVKPEGMTIERRDNNKDYSPDNCSWATRTAQARNRRSTQFLEIDGERKSVAEWAEERGIKRKVLERRVRDVWPTDQLFSTAALGRWGRTKRSVAV